MYDHLASLVSYPDAGLFGALDGCIQALAPEVPEAAALLEDFRDAPRSWGQAPWKKPTSRHLKCRPRLRSTSVTNSLAKTGAGAPLWPV